MSTVYADIDEYEMMPVYRDREAHCRLTPPNNADHGVSTLNKEQPTEYSPDQYFRIEDDKKTENKSYCHSKCNEQSSFSSSCKYQSSAIGFTVSEQTGTYFVLQKNRDDPDNHETRNPNRDSIENKNNIRTDTAISGCVPPTKYAKDWPHSNGLLNTTSNDMNTRIKNVRDDPSKDSAEIPNSNYDDNLSDDNTMNKQNSSGSSSIETNRIDDVIDTETECMHNEYHTLRISETVYQQEDDVTAIYM